MVKNVDSYPRGAGRSQDARFKGVDMRNQTVKLRFDGIYHDIDGDNLSFTFLDHFIGQDGRDYFKSSWIGVVSLLRTGVRLENVEVVARGPNYLKKETI